VTAGPVGERDWYTVEEVASRFDKTPQAVRASADNHRLPHDVVMHGSRKERRFPKASIDALDRWPGYGSRATRAGHDQVVAELDRLRSENAALHQEVGQLKAGRAAAEMRIDEFGRVVARQRRALQALVDALGDDDFDVDEARRLLS
jgi:hypothetical protein